MSYSKSPEAFIDCEQYFEQALASDKGIAITCENQNQATRLRQRLNTFRAMVRKKNSQIYSVEMPLHNRTPWDGLVVRKSSRGDHIIEVSKEHIIAKTSVEKL